MQIQLSQMQKLLGKLPHSPQTMDYLLKDYLEVEGWIEPEIFSVLLAVNGLQDKLKAKGGALEIGIHHGQFFIALANLIESGAKMVAVDVFDEQNKNPDQSGQGDEAVFRANLEKYCNKDVSSIDIIKSDSLDLKADNHPALAANSFRLISIDGSHTPTHTYSDLLLAEELLADGGVVILDDVLHPDWMGVMEGLMRYRLFSPGRLAPFLVTANKMVLCKAGHHKAYLEYFARQFPLNNKKTYRWTGAFLTAGKAPKLVP